MDDAARFELLRRDLHGFDDLRVEDFTYEIPATPGWDLAALLRHVGHSHRFALAHLRADIDDQPVFGRNETPLTDDELLAWVAAGGDELITELAASDLDALSSSFVGPQQRRFWLRRAALETAVLLWDAQSATRSPDPLDPLLAEDGVDEYFEVFLPLAADALPRAGSIHLHATDHDGEWFVEFAVTGMRWERGHHKGDAVVRGSMSDLLLLLWGRVPLVRLERHGDVDLVDRLLESAKF